MRFRIGPWIYRVRITEGPIISDDGATLAGQADEQAREIRISPAVPIQQRLDVLLHELRHAWLFHFPRPRTEEEDCNFSSAVTASAMADLDGQDGVGALMRMKPPQLPAAEPVPNPRIVPDGEDGPYYVPAGQVESCETTATMHGGRAQCSRCETIVAAGSIVTSEPRWDNIRMGNVCDRALYCPHCHAVQRWVEGCSLNGTPRGDVDEETLTHAGGAEADAFLRAHPDAVGLIPA